MNAEKTMRARFWSPAYLCRMDDEFLRTLAGSTGQWPLLLGACAIIVAGTFLYGAVMGLWRSPVQALYSGIKMPLLFMSVVLVSGLVNTMLANVLRFPVSFRTVVLLMLLGMAITAVVLGSLVPPALYFTLQAPSPRDGLVGLASSDPAVAPSMATFRALLLMHIAFIAVAGTAGYLKLLRLVRALTDTPTRAKRVLAAWIMASGFVGCELSWLFSPFVCKPNFPPHIVARTYFEGNFYEHVFHAIKDTIAR